MSIWVVLDLLNQFTNTRALSLFHNRLWQSKNSEVNVHIESIARDICVTVNNGCPRFMIMIWVWIWMV